MCLDRDGCKTKHVLFVFFLQTSSNSDANYLSTIENSIHLAVDTGIRDIILTGDFNFDMQRNILPKKNCDFCLELF